MSSQDPDPKAPHLHIEQDDFVAGDKHIGGDEVLGDKVAGDKVAGNKVEIGSISNSHDVYVAGGDINIFQRIVHFFQGDTEAQRAFRNRQNMLQLVWNTWIESVLKKSLHNEVLIELGMETKPDAVEHPWDMVVQMPDREPEIVKPGTTMLELFDQSNGSLLILGEPGSGKTTMLLELARLAILRAQEDPLQPIPVVFNLSSWKLGYKLETWLVDELRSRYHISPKIGLPWIETNDLMLLLDGLDEVKGESREACVAAINTFRSECSAPLAICSRRQEYEALQAYLTLRGAVLIQPLDKHTIDEYLSIAGNKFVAPYQTLVQQTEQIGDKLEHEFLHTPLFLSIFVLAYQNAEAESPAALKATDDYRKCLFDNYVKQMFKRRRISQHYRAEQTTRWLVWLARSMMEHSQPVFYIEDIRSGKLTIPPKKLRLIGVLIGVLIGGLLGGLLGGLTGLLIGGLIGGVSTGLANEIDIEPTEKLSFSWEGMRKAKSGNKGRGELVGMLIGGMIGGLNGGLNNMLIGGLIGWVGGGFVDTWQVEQKSRSVRMNNQLIVGLKSSKARNREIPGEGVGASLKYFLIVGLLFAFVGLLFGLFVGFDIGLIVGRTGYELFFGLIFGLLFGLMGGMSYGGDFILYHFITRFILSRSNLFPWHITPFLDYCTDRIFLRKVGGGYIFIHRMLMEHFAEMDEERIKAVAQK